MQRKTWPAGAPPATDHVAAFAEIGSAIGSSLAFSDVIQRILDTARRLISADVVTLRLLNGGLLRLAGVSGMDGDFPPGFDTLEIGESCIGRAIAERRPYPVTDLQQSPFLFRDLAHTRRLRSLLAIPLEFRDTVLGGLTCYWHRPRIHRREEIQLVTAIGAQAAIAIDHAHQYADSIHSLFALAKALESKDAYTVGHSERVTRVALLLAAEIGLGARDLNLLRQVCPLHDVGKVGVPDRILLKRGRLTRVERREMARHVEVGAEILAPVRAFCDGLPIVRSHHERVDGTGYPDGLKGDAIPLLARITSVADAFDAMTSRRPYREAMSVSAARHEIEQGAGSQFDTTLAHAFLRLLRSRDPRVLDVVRAGR